jgi:hypothetical protein
LWRSKVFGARSVANQLLGRPAVHALPVVTNVTVRELSAGHLSISTFRNSAEASKQIGAQRAPVSVSELGDFWHARACNGLRKMRGNLHRPSFSRCAIFEQTCGIERIGTSGCRRPLSTRVCRDKPETSPPPQCLPEVRRMRSRMATDREDGCALAPASTCYLVGVTPCDPAWAADTATGLHVLSRPRLAPWCRATVPNHTRQTPSVANKVKFLRGGAQNSLRNQGEADINGLAASDASVENDPLRKLGGPKCCHAQHGFFQLCGRV